MTHVMQTASRLALIATLTATPALLFAQTTTQEQPTGTAKVETDSTAATDAMTPTAEGTTAAADSGAAATQDSSGTATAQDNVAVPAEGTASMAEGTDTAVTTDDTTNMATADQAAQPVPGQIVMQSENTVLAKDLIGSNVYSEDGESIGDINNLIVNLDGSVEGVVIGVGGFLGMGEKDVAIEMASLTVTTDENANTRLMTSAKKADLEAANAFVTADEQRAAKKSLETMPAQDPAAVNSAPVTDVPAASE